jgi:hypothetical protein
MDEKFWHAANVVMQAAWMTEFLPDPTFLVVLVAGMAWGVMLLAFKNLAASADDFLGGLYVISMARRHLGCC